MSAGAPWSVKGIDPKARAAAKTLARQSGMTLGEWLNQVILEGDDGSEPGEGLAEIVARLTALEARVERLAADSGPRSDQAVRALAADVDARFAHMQMTVQASERRATGAVDRMGHEVLRVAEAVNRRLTQTEDRSAEAIDLVGIEIARVAGAVEARLARAETAQAEALERLSTEVARITDRFSERLGAAERRSAEAIASVGDQVAGLAERLAPAAAATPAAAPFVPELFTRAEPLIEEAPQPDAKAPFAAAPPFTSEDFQAADGFAPIPESDDDIFAAEPIDEPVDDARPELSTREVIDQARAAARAAQGAAQSGPQDGAPPLNVSARVERRQASGGLFAGFGQARGPARRRSSSAVHTAMMVAGGAAFLSVGAAGVILMEGPEGVQQAELSPFGTAPRAAVALAPGVLGPTAAPAAIPDDDAAAHAALLKVIAAITAGKPGGLSELKALADKGYAPAQLRLAHYYETGQAGVVKNLAEARRITILAAEAGSARAMHNLGVYYFRGEGGPQDMAAAAQWFRKAAAQGLSESQYNLGLMYQSGSGVTRDLSEARRWFDLAAAQGDRQAERAAEAITAQSPALTVPAAKRILERLGYYDGPMDAAASPDFKGALAQYQHDQGRTPTGDLDAGTVGLLSVYQR